MLWLCASLFYAGKAVEIHPYQNAPGPRDPAPGEAASYLTWWSAEAGFLAGCCSCKDSALRRAPVQGEKPRCNIFKVSQNIQLHPGSWSRRQTELMFYTFGYRFEFFPPHAKYLKPLETHDLTINDCAVLSIWIFKGLTKWTIFCRNPAHRHPIEGPEKQGVRPLWVLTLAFILFWAFCPPSHKQSRSAQRCSVFLPQRQL